MIGKIDYWAWYELTQESKTLKELWMELSWSMWIWKLGFGFPVRFETFKFKILGVSCSKLLLQLDSPGYENQKPQNNF